MNVEIGAEAALFPEKEYIKGIFVAVQYFFMLYVMVCESTDRCEGRGWCVTVNM
jgi:hypothetical protein